MNKITIVFELGEISDQRRETIEQEITDRLESLPDTYAGIEDWYILSEANDNDDLL